MEITNPNQLTSRIAKNYYKMIISGYHSPQVMYTQINCAFERNLLTLPEKVYLESLLDEQLIEQSEKEVQKLGK